MKIRKPLKLIGGYSILLGLSVIVMWIKIIMNESIPEGKTEMSFHLFSEFLMALLCLLSGFLLIRYKSKGTIANSAAHAMVLYSLINAMGYYAERNEKIMVAVFIFLAILSFIILIFYLFHPNKHYL
jgi:UDP-N-acetylmuramyl pentapeptide phosphotransferase/UDP-N-acetylglucosamine-1-phosphate transferase